MSEKLFVVYGFLREGRDRFGRKGTLYYIGKGTPERPYKCSKGHRRVSCPKDRSNIIILHKGLEEAVALEYEKELIKFYGRIEVEEFGILRNFTDGGEGVSGLIFSEESRKKMSESPKLSGRDHPGTKLHDWTHPEHGDHPSFSIKELIDKFPDQNLNYFSLHGVVKETNFSSKGWRLLKNKEYNREKSLDSHKRLCTWVHPKYGIIENTSAPDLVKMFPDEKLSRGNLSSVANGDRPSHKDWKILNGNCNNFSKESKKYDWTHEEYGAFKGVTIPELCEKFKDLKLFSSALSLVISGKISQHKGWKSLNPPQT
jgi:hypothetical protein